VTHLNQAISPAYPSHLRRQLRSSFIPSTPLALLLLGVIALHSRAYPQQTGLTSISVYRSLSTSCSNDDLPNAPASQPHQTPAGTTGAPARGQASDPTTSSQVRASQKQPNRILGLMPNYRAVSAGEIPPPPTAKEAFMVATHNSFDYSAFVFTGLTSLIAEGDDAHPQLGKGSRFFGRIRAVAL
jgi:hypothetical protein